MQNHADKKIAQLERRVADLEQRLATLSEKQQRDVTALMGCDEVLNKHRKLNDAELADAFARIVKLELTVFPHLARDMTDLNRMIGDGDDDQKAYNPLDFRDPTKKPR
jgi:hypothetical protein